MGFANGSLVTGVYIQRIMRLRVSLRPSSRRPRPFGIHGFGLDHHTPGDTVEVFWSGVMAIEGAFHGGAKGSLNVGAVRAGLVCLEVALDGRNHIMHQIPEKILFAKIVER